MTRKPAEEERREEDADLPMGREEGGVHDPAREAAQEPEEGSVTASLDVVEEGEVDAGGEGQEQGSPLKRQRTGGRTGAALPTSSGATTTTAPSPGKEEAVEGRWKTAFPLSKVRAIAKLDRDVSLVSQEALFLVTAATEAFLAHLTKEAYDKTRAAGRKQLGYKDVASVVGEEEVLAFLRDLVPMPVPLSRAKAFSTSAKRSSTAAAPSGEDAAEEGAGDMEG